MSLPLFKKETIKFKCSIFHGFQKKKKSKLFTDKYDIISLKIFANTINTNKWYFNILINLGDIKFLFS